MYTVIGTIKSRALRVIWMLEELGLPYEHHPHMPKSEDVLRLNPSGKVPVLIEGDTVLTDSAAILNYLADRHGQFSFPCGTLDRARQDGHTFFVLDELDATLWTAARHSFILPKEKRVEAVKDSLKWEFETSLARLAERLGDGPYLMGETMTVPDILAANCLTWAKMAKFPPAEGAVLDYVKRMTSRPAFQRAITNG
ncbi:MAG: glutathione S-transferase family protein [Rhodobacteraceae bacterium]|nr:glutathione S-transferase family protein [Paracoccaceae bacterium]